MDIAYYYKNDKKINVGLIIYKDIPNDKARKGLSRVLKFVTMDTQSLDAVYDLIKADLVEKI